MTKSVAQLPVVPFSYEEVMSGALPSLFARMAVEQGPILKHVVQSGPYTGQEFVYMVGPDANRFVLHTHRDHFSHHLGWAPIIGESLGRGLLTMDDPEHARHRQMWNPAFTSARVAAYLPIMQRVIAQRTRTWVERGEVDVYRETREITFDVAAAALAGFHTGPEVDRLRELFYILLHPFNGWQGTWEQVQQKMAHARGELTTLLRTLIAARRATPAEEQPHDVLGMIVHARDEQGNALSDEQILAHLNILLAAGHETTTTLSSWALYLMATQPEQRERVRAELAALQPDAYGVTSIEALRAAKVLDAFIREAGRLYSPVINVPRGVVKDFEFAGYTVSAGTPLRLALAAGHRLPHVFANPDVFDPDRFAPPREEDRRYPYALATFGGGSRVCIGMNVAQLEVKALAAHVLRSYALEPIGGQTPVHAGHWTAVLPGGMWMRVKTHT
jgi:cytochrome P450